jgi:uncharacterized membrane protein YbhN (UPF0104 family)
MSPLETVVPMLPLAAVAVLWLSVVELAKTARWWLLFGPDRPSFVRCLRALVGGQVTNQLSPLRAGEAVRLGMIAAQGAPLVPAAAAMAGAKAIDAVCLGAIAVMVVGTAALGRTGLGLAGAGLVLAGGVALALGGERLRPLLSGNPVARRLRLAALLGVAAMLREPRALAAVVGATALVWICGLAANWTVLVAVGVLPTFDLAARVIVVGYLVGLVPAPPGRLGVSEAGIAAALTSGGVGLGEAVVAAVVLRACQLTELGLLTVAGLTMVRRSKLAS